MLWSHAVVAWQARGSLGLAVTCTELIAYERDFASFVAVDVLTAAHQCHCCMASPDMPERGSTTTGVGGGDADGDASPACCALTPLSSDARHAAAIANVLVHGMCRGCRHDRRRARGGGGVEGAAVDMAAFRLHGIVVFACAAPRCSMLPSSPWLSSCAHCNTSSTSANTARDRAS